jgi:hypothetical protein
MSALSRRRGFSLLEFIEAFVSSSGWLWIGQGHGVAGHVRAMAKPSQVFEDLLYGYLLTQESEADLGSLARLLD